MDFILDNIFYLILAAAGVAQWLKTTQEAKKQSDEDAMPPTYEQPKPAEVVQDRRPKPPLPTSTTRPVSSPPTLSSVRKMKEELARQAAINEKLLEAQHAKKRKSEEKQATTGTKPSAPKATSSIRYALKNRNETRRALVLKEILDPPVGMR